MDRNPKFCFNAQMKDFEKMVGFSKAYIFSASVIILMLIAYVFFGKTFMGDIIAYLYPALASWRAIKQPSPDNRRQWLTYWVIFGMCSLCEKFLHFLVSWIPLYFFIRLGFLIWCYHPKTLGASVVYGATRPHLLQLLPASTAAPSTKAKAGGAKKSGGAGEAAPAPSASTVSAGTLNVTVVAAENLPVMELFSGTSDPYCLLRMDPPAGEKRAPRGVEKISYKTTCKPKTLSPSWNERIVLKPLESLDGKLVVTVMDKQSVGMDDFIGKVEVKLSSLPKNSVEEAWLTLTDPENMNEKGVSGEIHLKLELDVSS